MPADPLLGKLMSSPMWDPSQPSLQNAGSRMVRATFTPFTKESVSVAKNPDPALKLTTSKGVTRTLDDWSTVFHLCLVILPARSEASVYVPVGERIFATIGDADAVD